jgi:hypothetical protein
MYKSLFKVVFLLFGLTLFGCKDNQASKENEKEATPVSQKATITIAATEDKKVVTNLEKEISFDIIKLFKEDTSENSFVYGDTRLIHKTDNSFMLTKKDFAITDIDFSDINYEGPGFTMYSYQSSEDKKMEVIIIEGQADIGTAWYYVVVLNGEDLEDKFYVKEPRSNSETTNLKDFINVSLKDKNLILKFKKDKIAKYSKVTSNLKTSGNYLYLEKKIN